MASAGIVPNTIKTLCIQRGLQESEVPYTWEAPEYKYDWTLFLTNAKNVEMALLGCEGAPPEGVHRYLLIYSGATNRSSTGQLHSNDVYKLLEQAVLVS